MKPSGNKKVVLVVDDNQDAADTLALLIRHRGHTVCVAYDSKAGLQLASVHMPDIIFHDVAMPVPNGYEVAGILKGNPRFSNTLLVAVTAYNRTSDLHDSARAGFDVHIGKPMEYDLLEAVLRRVGG